jgi:hypothetical protein
MTQSCTIHYGKTTAVITPTEDGRFDVSMSHPDWPGMEDHPFSAHIHELSFVVAENMLACETRNEESEWGEVQALSDGLVDDRLAESGILEQRMAIHGCNN